MSEPLDFCKLFQNIEADPHAPVHMTVGQHLAAAYHARECGECAAIVERVATSYPEETGPGASLN